MDIELPAERIVSLRPEVRQSNNWLLSVHEAGPSEGHPVADLAVGGQTNLTVLRDRPVTFTRPLGGHACAQTIRFWADDRC